MKVYYKFLFALLAISVLNPACFADDVDLRSKQVLSNIYEFYKDSDKIGQSPRETASWVYSCLALNKDTEKANSVLSGYLADKQDYFTKLGSPGHDLYWELILLAKIASDERLNTLLDSQSLSMIKGVLWDFAKNFDSQDHTSTEPGKLLCVWGSDNHDMIHRGLFLITSQLLRNDPVYKDKLYNCGQIPIQRYDEWVKYMPIYFKERAATGTQIEFASSGYTGVFLQPIFLLFDCCENQQVREQAGKFLTLFFADASHELLNGVRGGSKVRVYKNYQAVNSAFDTLSYYNHIFYGQPGKSPRKYGNHESYAALVTSFRLPEIIKELAMQPKEKGCYEYISSRLAEGEVKLMGFEFAPGHKTPLYFPTIPSSLYRYTYATPSYILGWFAIDEAKHYIYINSQNQWMGAITAANADSRIFVQLTGTWEPRTGFRELQAVGNKHAVIIRKQISSNDIANLKVYYSNDFTIEDANGWIFGYNGDKSVYCAFKGTQPYGEAAYLKEDDEQKLGAWIHYTHPDTIIAMELAQASEYESFDAFKIDISDNKLEWEEYRESLVYEPTRNVGALKIFVDTRLGMVNDRPIDIQPDFTYSSPFMQSDYASHKILIKGLNGKSLEINFN